MNRHILKAWDAKIGKMITDKVEVQTGKFTNTTLVTNHGVLYIKTVGSETEVNLDNKNITILRPTELVDKNRKEIYERDILEIEMTPLKNIRVIVFFEDGTFKLQDDDGYIYPINMWLKAVVNSRIVGNIYENPELVEEDSVWKMLGSR